MVATVSKAAGERMGKHAGRRIRRLLRMVSEVGALATARYVLRTIADRLDPTLRPYHAAQWRRIRRGQYSRAISTLERLALSDPRDFQIYFPLGSAHHERGCMPDAVTAWARGMEVQAERARQAGVPSEPRYLGTTFTQSIGHIALFDIIAKRRLLGLAPVQKYIVLTNPKRSGNAAYLEYWREHFEIIKDPDSARRHLPVAELAEDYPTVLFLDGEWQWVHDVASKVEDRWEAAGRGALLKLTDEHRERAQVTLEPLGLPRDAWFVTLHVRDVYGRRRSGSIVDYLPAIQRITDAGGWVVRLGNPLMTKLPEMPRVLDYAHAQRQDWLDVYLIAAARFFVGTNSGPAWAAGTFGVPALLTNWAPMGIQSHHANTVTLPQLLWSEVENRPLSFAEQMTEPFAYGETNFVLERGGVASVANTSEEIACAVDEMLLRTHGEWSAPDGDEERQQSFKSRLREAGISGRSRIASGFLHKYADLLVHTR